MAGNEPRGAESYKADCIHTELYVSVSQMLTSVANVVIMLQVYGYPLSRSGKKSSRIYYIVYGLSRCRNKACYLEH